MWIHSMTKLANAFKKMAGNLDGEFYLTGDCLLVEKIEEVEAKSKGGIIVNSAPITRQVNGIEANRPNLVRVIAVGNGYFDKDDKAVPLETKVGDVILVGRLDVHWYSCFGPVICDSTLELGMTTERNIQAYFAGESYVKSCDILKEVVYS